MHFQSQDVVWQVQGLYGYNVECSLRLRQRNSGESLPQAEMRGMSVQKIQLL